MICYNCSLKLKLIIYVEFQFSPYSFNFRFTFGYFNYFSMQVLIAFDWVLQMKFIIYLIFHFSPYSFNFVKHYNFFKMSLFIPVSMFHLFQFYPLIEINYIVCFDLFWLCPPIEISHISILILLIFLNKITLIFFKNIFISLVPNVFICFNFFDRLEIIIYYIFYFDPYCLKFLFSINFFGLFCHSWTTFYFIGNFYRFISY